MPGTLYVEIVTPDESVFRGEASRFRAPSVNGSFEVLYNHAPMLAALGIGKMEVVTPQGERIAFATSGGFAEVFQNEVRVLVRTAEPASAIDLERARQAENRALERLRGVPGVERARAEEALERARNRVRIAMGAVGTRR